MSGLHFIVELDPVRGQSVKCASRVERSSLDLVAYPRFEVLLLTEAVILAVPDVSFWLEPRVGDVVTSASAKGEEMIDLAGSVAARIDAYSA